MLATTTTSTGPSATAASAVPGQWHDMSSAHSHEAEDKLDFSPPSSPNPPSYRPMTGTTSMATLANAPNGNEGTLAYGAGGVRTLAVDGADDTLRIVFSSPSGGKRPLYKLEAPKPPDSGDFPIEVQGLLEDVEMFDLTTQSVSAPLSTLCVRLPYRLPYTAAPVLLLSTSTPSDLIAT